MQNDKDNWERGGVLGSLISTIFILRRGDVMSILLEILDKFCKKINAFSESSDGWPETGGQSHGWRLAFLISRVYGIC
jgi:hypothetical protein